MIIVVFVFSSYAYSGEINKILIKSGIIKTKEVAMFDPKYEYHHKYRISYEMPVTIGGKECKPIRNSVKYGFVEKYSVKMRGSAHIKTNHNRRKDK